MKIKKSGFWAKYGEDYLFVMPFFLLFFVFTVLPVLVSVLYSFTYFNVLEPPEFIGLKNYYELFIEDDIFMVALKNTLLLSLVIGPAGFLLSFVCAWLLNEFKHALRTVLTVLFYVPAMSANVFLVWQVILSNDSYGILNSFLMRLGFITSPIDWLHNTDYMMPTIILVSIWLSLGTSFLSFIAGLQNVDTTLIEAGAIDGIRSRWQELYYIILPGMRNQLMFGAVMSITSSFGMGGIITQLAGYPSTNYAVHTLVHHLEDYGGMRYEMGYASAIAVVLFGLMIGANSNVQKMIRKIGGD